MVSVYVISTTKVPWQNNTAKDFVLGCMKWWGWCMKCILEKQKTVQYTKPNIHKGMEF